ncbi:hypothetical protein KR067_001321, partial [Drosophila pandora]
GYEMNYDQMGTSQGFGQPAGGFGQESRNMQSGAAALGGPGYRSPLRYQKIMREMNSRNGLYSPMDQQRGGGQGDYYSSLPGIGGAEGQIYRGNRGNGSSNQNSYF